MAPTSQRSGADGPLRALRVLETLGGMEQPAGLAGIAAANGLTKTKAYRVLRSLQNEGYVDHVGRSGYRVGSRSIALPPGSGRAPLPCRPRAACSAS